ncbi:MAG TPA: TetR/AcrR family transcriptional regulator [Opitutaceae bacterium]
MIPSNASARRGRPRDDAADQRLLAAAFDLISEAGYAGFNIDEVARRTSISKATIYRRWGSGGELLLDVLLDFAARKMSLPNTGKLERDLTTYFRALFGLLNEQIGEVLRGLVAEAQTTPSFRQEFRERFIMARRAPVQEMLRAAQKRGELAHDADIDALLDFIFGAMWYRLLIEHAPLNEKFVTAIAALAKRYCPARQRKE